jgi:hypothetical protein
MSILGLPQHYDLTRFMHMRPQGPHMPITESYVAIPTALWIRDDEGALWTLGFDYDEASWRGGRYEYDIVRNGVNTGEFGRFIEFRKRKVRIWGSEGWKTWTGRCFI